MPDLVQVLQAGAAQPWLYWPVAVLLGGLHALEPGHSKSMIAAFIIAIRGAPRDALLLGVSAAIGHSLVVWALAVVGLAVGDALIAERAEPWLALLSGLLVMGLAARLLWLIRRGLGGGCGCAGHAAHNHDHHHHAHDHDHGADPHAAPAGDAHAQAHEQEILTRFGGRGAVSSWEILWFGFSGGLLPCPAAIAVLLICLRLKEWTLGAGMVAGFSLGLAITLVAVGLLAAYGVQSASKRWSLTGVWSRRLPYVSAGLVFVMGAAMSVSALRAL